MATKACAVCGAEFEGRTSTKTCGPECSKRRARERTRQNKQTPEYKEQQREYRRKKNHAPEHKEYQRKYRQTARYKEWARVYALNRYHNAPGIKEKVQIRQQILRQSYTHKWREWLRKQYPQYKEKERTRRQCPEFKERELIRRQTSEHMEANREAVRKYRSRKRVEKAIRDLQNLETLT
jgi:hypothetical protein